jgi:predicted transcriptional regulator
MTEIYALEVTSDIVSAYVGKNHIEAEKLPDLIKSIHAAVVGLSAPAALSIVCEEQKPAVSVRKSVSDDALICLDCGHSFKSLKRHLSTHHGLSPDEYRTKWKLNADYPMVAPLYAEQRSALAKEMGLGRKPTRHLKAA